MTPFELLRPATLEEAVAAAARPGAAVLAGGTNLVDLMKTGATRPTLLVDVTRLPELDRIELLEDGGARIGAMVRNADLARDPTFGRSFPSVVEALLSGASPQLRNAATVGGNLLQSTRCPYFFDAASACNRRAPGTGCDAREGENRTAAILGWSEACIATHPSDFCVPLVALDASVEVVGPAGARTVALETLHRLPGDDSARSTTLAPGEIVVALRLPAKAASFRDNARYLKLRERTSYAFALVSVAAALDVAQGRIRAARLTLGAVAAKPWRAREAEAVLADAAPDRAAFTRAAEAAVADARPSGDNADKIVLARRLVVRALEAAAAGTPERTPALPASVLADTGALTHA
jgi:xanthine dehydrogenase YagS FAD-binding subunit